MKFADAGAAPPSGRGFSRGEVVGAAVGAVLGGAAGVLSAAQVGSVEHAVLAFLLEVLFGLFAGWVLGRWWQPPGAYDPLLHRHLRDLVRRHGPTLWEDDAQGQALVRAVLEAQPRQAYLLCRALALGVVERLDAEPDEPPVQLLRAQATRLVLRAGLEPLDALWAVYTWSWALGQRPLTTAPPILPPGQKHRPRSLREAVFDWLVFVVVALLILSAASGLLLLLFGVPFWGGVLAGLMMAGVPLLALTVLRVWIFLVRLLFFDGIALLDRDLPREEPPQNDSPS